jgi:hypothetical protein
LLLKHVGTFFTNVLFRLGPTKMTKEMERFVHPLFGMVNRKLEEWRTDKKYKVSSNYETDLTRSSSPATSPMHSNGVYAKRSSSLVTHKNGFITNNNEGTTAC